MDHTIEIKKELFHMRADSDGVECYAPTLKRDLDGIYIREQAMAEVLMNIGFFEE